MQNRGYENGPKVLCPFTHAYMVVDNAVFVAPDYINIDFITIF